MTTTTEAQPLLDIPSAASTRWIAESMQLVNWGGFQGHHTLSFDAGSTLITGKSGTGKSTVLDAYLALMMPSDVAFNGASNDAGGRARSPERRNLVSYLRGQYGTSADTDGRSTPLVLRGATKPTWGAIAMTFVTGDGSHAFTALRAYYVPAGACTPDQLTMRMVTVPGRVDLAALDRLTGSKFKPTEVRDLFPGARTHDSYQSLANTLETSLGIGANGNGQKALRMLVRVQSSAQLPDVDSLFKQTVLDEPKTFAAADAALRAFDGLDDSYARMVLQEERVELLTPIREQKKIVDAAGDARAAHEEARLDSAHGPYALWAERVRYDVLDHELAANGAERADAGRELAAATAAKEDADAELRAASAAYDAAGGDQIVALQTRIAELVARRDERKRRLDRLAGTFALVGATADSRADLEVLVASAGDNERAAKQQEDAADAKRDQVSEALSAARREAVEARKDLDSYRSRNGRVERCDDERRNALAAAAGLDPRDLPFVAELIDVADGESRWRDAIETVLRSEARTVLVDGATADVFSSRIDLKHIPGRINFAFAVPDQPRRDPEPASTVAGKLEYKDCRWTGWLQENLARHPLNATCVETTDELKDHRSAVTNSGQTRRGDRGAHGRHRGQHVIGFSNEDAVRDATDALRRAEAAERDHATALVDVRAQRARATALASAWSTLRQLDVDDHDVFTTAQQISDARADVARLEGADDRLAHLKAKRDAATDTAEQAGHRRFAAGERAKAAGKVHGDLVAAQDGASGRLEALESAGVEVSDALTARLEGALAAAARPDDPRSAGQLSALDGTLERMRASLGAEVDTHRQAATRASEAIAATFRQYQQRWPDPNLGQSLASYPDYLQILEDIESSGLAEQRRNWRDHFLEWTGQDLVPLNQMMEDAVADIQNRLDPVNDVLADLPFGPQGHRLRMQMRRLNPVAVTAFRRDLRQMSRVATAGLDEDALVAAFMQLRTFMDGLRRKEDPRAPQGGTDRARLLDVRQHVQITAEQVTTEGNHVATHASLTTQSGGETQEVGAFVAGAALRYRLGDPREHYPRFAPVVIDEAFIKADEEFTARGVHAWQSLGFQLIIGAPVEKYNGIERSINSFIAVSKDLETKRSYAHHYRDYLDILQTEAGTAGSPE